MRICLLTTQDLDADPFPPDDWPCDPRPFFPEAEWVLEVLERETAIQRVLHRVREGFDLFFNLCDGAWAEASPGIEVVEALERAGVPFTGATSVFYEPARATMKHVCGVYGIDAPAYVMAESQEDVELAASCLRFPMIVKHPNSYASVDLVEGSRVTTVEALRERAAIMIGRHTATLIEEFIEGIECTVLVVENASEPSAPIAYPPMQYVFPDGHSFKHETMKWVEYGKMQCVPVADPALAARLQQVSADMFRGLEGAGFGRVDMRVDAEGRIFVLEINPNCGVFYPPRDPGSADLCLMQTPDGHVAFTRQLIDAAFARHARTRRSWIVQPVASDGFGLIATRMIAAGEVVVAFEHEAHRLVSLAAGARAREPLFDRTAWPITDELWVAWSRDPARWVPINHGCDPNLWFEGLDLVARRAIPAGTELTLDYATVFNERMPSFACRCGAGECRGEIRGGDYREAFVGRYGRHVSAYVASKRAEAAPGRARAVSARTG